MTNDYIFRGGTMQDLADLVENEWDNTRYVTCKNCGGNLPRSKQFVDPHLAACSQFCFRSIESRLTDTTDPTGYD